MGIKKQFSNLNDIKKLGILLRVSDTVLQESLVLTTNNLNKTDTLVKRINNISEQISKLRSDIDEALVKIIDADLHRALSNEELNSLIYTDLDEKECLKVLLGLKGD